MPGEKFRSFHVAHLPLKELKVLVKLKSTTSSSFSFRRLQSCEQKAKLTFPPSRCLVAIFFLFARRHRGRKIDGNKSCTKGKALVLTDDI